MSSSVEFEYELRETVWVIGYANALWYLAGKGVLYARGESATDEWTDGVSVINIYEVVFPAGGVGRNIRESLIFKSRAEAESMIVIKNGEILGRGL